MVRGFEVEFLRGADGDLVCDREGCGRFALCEFREVQGDGGAAVSLLCRRHLSAMVRAVLSALEGR